MYTEPKRIEYLDSVRGLAALFVLLSHAIGAFAWPAAYGTFSNLPFISILFNGKEAVCMFFVLSGYVLSKPYLASAENESPREIFLPTFYTRRATRIWLPWFFVFVASILCRKFCFGHPRTNPPISSWLAPFWGAPMTPGDFFRQCIFTLHDNARQLLIQDWSLGVELKGSFLIPFFIFLLLRRHLVLLLLTAVAFLFLVGTGHYYVSFIIGVLLARYGIYFTLRFLPAYRVGKFLFLLLGLALYQTFGVLVAFSPEVGPIYRFGWVATSLGCALVLLCSFGSRSLQNWLHCKPIVFLGRVSYSVYLLQFIVILCLLPPLVHLANQWGVVNRLLLFATTMLASMAATILLAAVTYRFVELPTIDLGHRLTKKIQNAFQK